MSKAGLSVLFVAMLALLSFQPAQSQFVLDEDFSTYTSSPSSIGWFGADNTDFGVFTPGTTTDGSWINDGFGNVGTTGSPRFNLFSTTSTDMDWLISPPADMNATPVKQLSYDLAATAFTGTAHAFIPAGDTLFVVISTDGTTWSRANILAMYTSADSIPAAGMTYTVDLTAYGTDTVQIGFLAWDPANPGDMNIYFDNVQIGAPPPVEMAVTGLSAGFGGVVQGSAGFGVEIQVTNNGNLAAAADSLDVYLNGGLASSLGYPALNPGEMADLTAMLTASGSGSDSVSVAIRLVGGDADPGNDTASVNVTIEAGFYLAPFSEDFESFAGSTVDSLWFHLPAPRNWTADANGTPSSNTGPSGDHTTGAGNYMFTEATGPSPGDAFILGTPFVDLSGTTNPRLKFWYHMYGAAMGELHVDVYANGVMNLDVMTPIVGQQQTGSGDPYLEANVDLTAFAGQTVAIAFRGIRGSDFTSDMAIDDVEIGEPPATDLAVTSFFNLPTLVAGASTVDFDVEISNLGGSSLTSDMFDLFLNGGLSSSYAYAALNAGEKDTVSVSYTASASGIDTVLVAVRAVPGDGNPSNDTLSAEVGTLGLVGVPFSEVFPTTTFDPISWPEITGTTEIIDVNTVATGTFPYPVPSDPFFLSVNGSNATLASGIFDLSAQSNLVLAMWESEHDLEIGEDVVLEYLDSSGVWQTLFLFVGTNNGFGTFEPFELVVFPLPGDAYHDGFRFRFASVGGLATTDEWFFDNIFLGQSAPDIGVDPATLDFGMLFTGEADTLSFTVSNTGTDSLTVSGMTNSDPAFSIVGATSFGLPTGGSVDVSVAFAAGAPGGYADSIVITSDASSGDAVVSLLATVADPPIVGVSDTLLSETVLEGDSIVTSFWLYNSGGSDLDFTISENEDPLTADVFGAIVQSETKVKVKVAEKPSGGKKNLDDEMVPAKAKVKAPRGASVKTSAVATEKAPKGKASGDRGGTSPNTEGLFDLQFEFDVEAASGLAGNAGSEFDGTFFYTTRWASNLIHKYDMAGNLVEEFSIPGVTGLRDLAFDGTHMYGGAAATTIFQMDFVSKTLVGTITSPIPVRHISYDEGSDGFWVGNWDTDVVLVSRAGATLATLPAATHGLGGMYGSAYDPYSAGGPFLWLFDQGLGAGFPQPAVQFDIGTLTPTGVSFDVVTAITSGGIAGGMFVAQNIVPGTATLGGIIQGDPGADKLFGLELTAVGLDWIEPDIVDGTIAAGDSVEVTLTWYGILPVTEDIVEGYLGIESNDPATPIVNVHAVLDVMVVGIDDQELLPTSFELFRNYPNPFNPSTTIKYNLKNETKVSLQVYNVLGQHVRTLVSGTQNAGRYEVIWDGKNDLGNHVSTGVYIYRIEAENFIKSHKMMLLK